MKGLAHSRRYLFWGIFLMYPVGIFAQTASSIRISFYETELENALVEVSTASGINVVFSPDMIPEKIITGNFNDNVHTLLTALLEDTGLQFREQDGQIILYRDVAYFLPFNISGYVEDSETGEHLFAAHITDLVSGAVAVTNEYGFFSLQTRGQRVRLKVSYLGYKQDTIIVTRNSRTVQEVPLDRLLLLKEVVIDADAQRQFNLEPLSRHRYSDRQLETKPALGGEQDIHRFLETQPGVSIGTDGIGGLHIRGGNGDQNLVLFDGVPLYHSTHAIGILSVFNPLMMREVSLLKGDYPARYAGRLSSVLDVRTKEGNDKEWSFQGGVGSTTANALLEGPIIKDKIAVLFAARRFLPGFYLRNLSKREKEDQGLTGETNYAFTDLNAKINYSLSPKNKLYLSFYHGDDSYDDLTNAHILEPNITSTQTYGRQLNWGNSLGVLRWNHQFGPHVFANTTFTVSSFELQSVDTVYFREIIASQIEHSGYAKREFKSKIKDEGGRFDIDHFISNKHRVRYGVSLMQHHIAPKSIAYDDEAQLDSFFTDEGTLDDALFSELRSRALEGGIYLEDYLDLGSNVSMSTGAHLSSFYIEDKTYWSLQPRFNFEWHMHKNGLWHMNISKMTQYMHLLTSSGIGLPTDLWVPSTDEVEPEHAEQITTGLAWQITPALRVQSDVYYKRLRNLVTYSEGASFLFTQGSVQTGILDAANWEDKITSGNGEAYGSETMLSLSGKTFDVEIGYTLAYAKRQFDELNFGREFDFRYDRRHAVSISAVKHVNKRLMLSAVWNYASGIPITLAQSKFLHPSSSPIFPPVEVLEFSEYNAYRLPSYHRLDLGVKYFWRNPKATHSLHLDVYNAYNRHNVLYVTLIQEGDEFKNQQFTVLPFIPSLSYQLKI